MVCELFYKDSTGDYNKDDENVPGLERVVVWLRKLPALPEDLNSLPSTYIGLLTPSCNCSTGLPDALFPSQWVVHSQEYTHAFPKCTKV